MPYLYNERKYSREELFDLIERMFFNMQLIKKIVAEKKEEFNVFLSSNKLDAIGGGHSNVSDPTFQKVVNMINEIKYIELPHNAKDGEHIIYYPQKWIDNYNAVFIEYMDNQKVSRILYSRYAQQQTATKIIQNEKLQKNKYYNLITEVLNFAINVAIQQKLITVV